MSKFRNKTKINVGGKLSATSVVAVVTTLNRDLENASQSYSTKKGWENLCCPHELACDYKFKEWGSNLSDVEKDKQVVISFVNHKTPRVEFVMDSTKIFLLMSTGYMTGLAKRVVTHHAIHDQTKEISPSIIKVLDLVMFVYDSGLDVYETKCNGERWNKLKKAICKGYYWRSSVDNTIFAKKEITPYLSTRYEPTTWYAIVAKNYYDYMGERYMSYFKSNLDHYKSNDFPSTVALSEIAYMERKING
jgi:hypothetical protein